MNIANLDRRVLRYCISCGKEMWVSSRVTKRCFDCRPANAKTLGRDTGAEKRPEPEEKP